MGTSTSGAELARKISTAGRNLAQSQRKSVEAGAEVMRRAIAAAEPSRLRGVGRNGARVGVAVHAHGGGTDAIAVISPAGPLWLYDLPTRAHLITSKRGGGRATRSRRLGGLGSGSKASQGAESLLGVGPVFGRGRVSGAINITGVGWRAYARQGGTRGAHAWQRARAGATAPAQTAMAIAPVKAVAEAFR